jgi:hypothetical protein
VRRPLAWLLGGFAAARFVRRRRQAHAPAPDPRADELRQRLAESRGIVDEREEFEAAETPVDEAEPAPHDPDDRRRAVHEAAREAAERMRGEPS